jgi:hypothetical protein
VTNSAAEWRPYAFWRYLGVFGPVAQLDIGVSRPSRQHCTSSSIRTKFNVIKLSLFSCWQMIYLHIELELSSKPNYCKGVLA